jgi:hypothetical protein
MLFSLHHYPKKSTKYQGVAHQIQWVQFFFLVVILCWTQMVSAQCGVNQSCGPGGVALPKICRPPVCFTDPETVKKYEQLHNCRFAPDGNCGEKIFDTQTQCCGQSAKAGGGTEIQNKQAKNLDPKFNWEDYKKQCGSTIKQSESPPDQFWQQCEVGKPHDPQSDSWPVGEVISAGNSKARSHCVDGCSTPPAALSALVVAGTFLVYDKDNPTGHQNSSFYSACAAHDLCYQKCNISVGQVSCDDTLLAGMLNACENVPEDHETLSPINGWVSTAEACRSAAGKMIIGVRIGGAKAFGMRRQQYCQCC